MTKTKLKVGLMLDSYTVPAWLHRLIEEIRRGDYAEFALVILNQAESERLRRSAWAKIRRNYRRVLPLLARGFFERLYTLAVERHLGLPDAAAPTDCQALLAEVPTLAVAPVARGWSDYFSKGDVAEIRGRGLDVLIRAGFRILRGEILQAAKCGVWSFHHGDNRVNRGGPAGFWETMENWPETGSVLQILTEDLDNGKVLYRSFSCTDDMSVTENRNNYYWKSLMFVPRKLRELHAAGAEAFLARVEAENRHPQFYAERLYTRPGTARLALLVFRKIASKVRRQVSWRVSFDQWILMFHLHDEFSTALWRYRPIVPPADRFWADPHVVYRDGKYYLFIEEYLYASARGRIALMTMDESGRWTPPEPVLERPYHLSYPFVFEHRGDHYMIPETADHGTVELYRCVEFPHRWEFRKNLMEGITAVDATVHFHNGRWWLFADIREIGGSSASDELFLFSSDDPVDGEWHPHPQNPVVSDCKTSRPAGKIFSLNGTLYRPSQDCSHRYGYGFNLLEITRLDEDEYAESLVSKVEPHWNPRIVGTHTFNRVGRLHVIDALYRRRRFGGPR